MTDPMLNGITRCHVCGDEITDWGFGDWHHVPSPDEDAYLKGHDHLCSRRHPQVAYPRRVCPECRAVEAARAEGYARGLIEGDHGGRREGYRIGYDTAWSLSAAEIERQTLDKATEAVAALAPTWSVTFYVSRPSNGEWIGCNGAHEQVDVLAAIAALRGES